MWQIKLLRPAFSPPHICQHQATTEQKEPVNRRGQPLFLPSLGRASLVLTLKIKRGQSGRESTSHLLPANPRYGNEANHRQSNMQKRAFSISTPCPPWCYYSQRDQVPLLENRRAKNSRQASREAGLKEGTEEAAMQKDNADIRQGLLEQAVIGHMAFSCNPHPQPSKLGIQLSLPLPYFGSPPTSSPDNSPCTFSTWLEHTKLPSCPGARGNPRPQGRGKYGPSKPLCQALRTLLKPHPFTQPHSTPSLSIST